MHLKCNKVILIVYAALNLSAVYHLLISGKMWVTRLSPATGLLPRKTIYFFV